MGSAAVLWISREEEDIRTGGAGSEGRARRRHFAAGQFYLHMGVISLYAAIARKGRGLRERRREARCLVSPERDDSRKRLAGADGCRKAAKSSIGRLQLMKFTEKLGWNFGFI